MVLPVSRMLKLDRRHLRMPAENADIAPSSPPLFLRAAWLATGTSVLLWALPWVLRRPFLCWIFGYQIHPAAYVGFSIVIPKRLIMGSHAYIGHLNFIRRQDLMELQEYSSIGHMNSFGGYGNRGAAFAGQLREAALIVGRHAAITSRHLFDCTDRIEVGAFSLIAGYRSQFLTHAPDLKIPRQVCAPIRIGEYVFIGSGAIVLKNVTIPHHVVISAGSLIKRSLPDSYWLYEGVPAAPVRQVDSSWGFFTRQQGSIQ